MLILYMCGFPFLKKWFILYVCGWFSQCIPEGPRGLSMRSRGVGGSFTHKDVPPPENRVSKMKNDDLFCSHMERGVDMLTIYYIWKGFSFLMKRFLLYVDWWFSQCISEVPRDPMQSSRSPVKDVASTPKAMCAVHFVHQKHR